MGRKINILIEKLYFQHFTYFKLLRRIQGNPINSCDFLKSLISVRGGHCDYSPWGAEKHG